MNVLIATDGTPTSAAALAWAARVIDPATATVHVVSVVPLTALLVPATPGVYLTAEILDEMRATNLAAARRALDDARVALGALAAEAIFEVLEGEPIAVIADLARAQAADMVIVGSGAKGAAARLVLGSVSEGLLHRLPGAVVLVHPPAPALEAAS